MVRILGPQVHGDLVLDEDQIKIKERLDRLRRAIMEGLEIRPLNRFARLFGIESKKQVMGLYLWGDVGRGKTMLMDAFCEKLPSSIVSRYHFYRFMQKVHASLDHYSGQTNPLEKVAGDFASEVKVLCFDEFFVSDIGDAMILGELFKSLFKKGVVLVATSNVEPANLYKNGLQRARFLPAIRLLVEHCEVARIGKGADYRLTKLTNKARYLHPENLGNKNTMREIFNILSHGIYRESVSIEILGRAIETTLLSDEAVWFTFKELCDGPRSQNDYIEIANRFKTVFLDGLPVLSSEKDNQARRLVSLVDELYDRRINLVVMAQIPIDKLYTGAKLKFEFERTKSRLIEMQSPEYVASFRAQ
ncbi:MAG: cell division protein ZapE [Gammaproteobacteria bacterium]|nr:cell division protein ZapE [Gammaproteobacteria bacterium]